MYTGVLQVWLGVVFRSGSDVYRCVTGVAGGLCSGQGLMCTGVLQVWLGVVFRSGSDVYRCVTGVAGGCVQVWV